MWSKDSIELIGSCAAAGAQEPVRRAYCQLDDIHI
jgi:hypothetical protein